MKPSPELDALIAEKVMGYRDCFVKNEVAYGCRPEMSSLTYTAVPHYSRSINSAWEVVEKVTARPQISFSLHGGGNQWRAQFCNNTTMESLLISDESAETAPHAVCFAALKAVGEKL